MSITGSINDNNILFSIIVSHRSIKESEDSTKWKTELEFDDMGITTAVRKV